MVKLCPKCSSTTHVMECRDLGNRFSRRRYCNNQKCLHRYSTYEVSAEDYQRLKEVNIMKSKLTEILENL
jgi:transcriptional regulator NrdR family protein